MCILKKCSSYFKPPYTSGLYLTQIDLYFTHYAARPFPHTVFSHSKNSRRAQRSQSTFSPFSTYWISVLGTSRGDEAHFQNSHKTRNPLARISVGRSARKMGKQPRACIYKRASSALINANSASSSLSCARACGFEKKRRQRGIRRPEDIAREITFIDLLQIERSIICGRAVSARRAA